MKVHRNSSVTFPTFNNTVKALFDTGADVSSIRASVHTKGKQTITFSCDLTRGKHYTTPIVSTVNVETAMGNESRPIVQLPITINSQTHSVSFTISDNSSSSVPVLIGVEAMNKFGIVVDPSGT